MGPVRDGDRWRIRKNRELYGLYGDIDVVRFIKLGRLSWAGHVSRMQEDVIARKIMDTLHGEPADQGSDGLTEWQRMHRAS